MTEGLDEELESFAFALRSPADGKGRRRPNGDSTINAYVYTARRFKEFMNGAEVTSGTAQDFVRSLELSEGDVFLSTVADERIAAGEWKLQRDVYQKATEVGRLSVNDWLRYALLQLRMGDIEALHLRRDR